MIYEIIELIAEKIRLIKKHRCVEIPENATPAQRIGITGENFATAFYIKKGFEILERNYHQYGAEIDIVAKNNKYYVFCEVKTTVRSPDVPNKFGRPASHVDRKQQKNIIRAASYFTHRYRNSGLRFRFDVIEVYLNEDLTLHTLHPIYNAFTANR